MATVYEVKLAPSPVSPSQSEPEFLDSKEGTVTIQASDIPPLGKPIAQKRWWWQRGVPYDANATATLVSHHIMECFLIDSSF
jgi:hypothetical protein